MHWAAASWSVPGVATSQSPPKVLPNQLVPDPDITEHQADARPGNVTLSNRRQ